MSTVAQLAAAAAGGERYILFVPPHAAALARQLVDQAGATDHVAVDEHPGLADGSWVLVDQRAAADYWEDQPPSWMTPTRWNPESD